MLTQTLRKLERDRLVRPKVHPVVPAGVDYGLTRLGGTLTSPLLALYRMDRGTSAGDLSRSERRAIVHAQGRGQAAYGQSIRASFTSVTTQVTPDRLRGRAAPCTRWRWMDDEVTTY